jgi:gliding motility-associated-like protein
MKKLKTYCLLLGLFVGINLSACPTITLSATNVSCNGGFDGTTTFTISGSNAPFDYVWNIGSTSNSANNVSSGTYSASGLPAGVFTIQVTDNIGCTSIQVITITQPDSVTTTMLVEDVLCYGETTGNIYMAPTGGTPPYTYTWSNGSTSQNLIGVGANSYNVTIKDNNNCYSKVYTGTINQPVSPMQSSYVYQNVSCKFGSDGAIDLSVWGGTAPYTFSWNSGAFFTEDISNIPAATYNVTVNDLNNCSIGNSIIISEPTMLTSTISESDVLCNGDATGSVNLSPNGGTPPYSFSWTNSTLTLGNTEDLNNVPAENYSVTITDNNGCTATNNIVVNEPPPLTSSIASNNVSCYGGTDGNIYLTVNGGTPTYSFVWSNSSVNVGTIQNLTNIPAETYSVIITDNNNCSITNSVEITQPQAPLSLTHTQVDVLCYGNNTGEIDITVTGGTPNYTFSWSNSAVSEDVVNLFAGTYNITVQDALGCIESDTITIIQPQAPLAVSAIINNVLCYGDSTGSVNATTTGGTSPYVFAWTNSQFSLSTTTEDLINYPAETYYLTITDNHNCMLSDTFKINQPDDLVGTLVPTHVLCYGDATGAIDLTVIGGVTPYNYNWSNGQITEDLVNIVAGNYTVTITDDHNCTFTDSVTVTQPLAPLSGFYGIDEPYCPGGNDGNIYYQVEGGTVPYSYLWSSGQTTPSIFDMLAGSYQITTTDAHGCILVDLVELTEPDPIVLNEIVTNLTCFESNDGSVDLTVTGGTPPYNFDWTNSTYELSFNQEDLIDFKADVYSVTVLDSHLCSVTQSFIITQPDLLVVEPIEQNISCYGAQDGGIELIVSGGTPQYNYSWATGDTTAIIDSLGAGVYYYTVFDDHSCFVEDSVILNEPPPIYFNEVITPVSCRDQKDGKIEVFPTGGYGEYEYDWEIGSTDSYIDNLLGGFYTLTVTDLVGCEKDTTFEMPVIDIECLEVPTAFTPNDDGMNDDWQIKNIFLYPEAKVSVYNKWGKIVYQIENGYTNPWDGTKNGHQLPADTYFYIIYIRDDIHPYTGPITIVR